jgi:hypothetical protein
MSSKASKKTVMKCDECEVTGHKSNNKMCTKHPEHIDYLLRKKDRSQSEQLIVIEFAKDHIQDALILRKMQIKRKEKWGKNGGRLDGLSQEASQVLIMLIYNHKLKDMSCRKPESGDLISEKDGRIECKCKSCQNNAPGSCGGEQHWDTLVFLDATGLLEDKYRVWRLKIKDTDPRWNKYKPANTDKTKKMVRPRLPWDKIEEDFKEDIEVIFEGTFEDIFKDEPALGTP